jgi:hypothetical protein
VIPVRQSRLPVAENPPAFPPVPILRACAVAPNPMMLTSNAPSARSSGGRPETELCMISMGIRNRTTGTIAEVRARTSAPARIEAQQRVAVVANEARRRAHSERFSSASTVRTAQASRNHAGRARSQWVRSSAWVVFQQPPDMDSSGGALDAGYVVQAVPEDQGMSGPHDPSRRRVWVRCAIFRRRTCRTRLTQVIGRLMDCLRQPDTRLARRGGPRAVRRDAGPAKKCDRSVSAICVPDQGVDQPFAVRPRKTSAEAMRSLRR